jgi:hypothetical protein
MWRGLRNSQKPIESIAETAQAVRWITHRAGLMVESGCADVTQHIVPLNLCPQHDLRELRFINTAFPVEPGPDGRRFLAEHRAALPQPLYVVAR